MRAIRWLLPTFLVAMPLAAALQAQQPPHWEASLEAAKRQAAQTNRLVLAHFWAPWCGPCRQLETNVFIQPGVAQAIEARFVPVKVNADDFPATARLYDVERLPTDVIITPTGRLLFKLACPQDPRQYLAQLDQAAVAATTLLATAAPPPAVVVPPANLQAQQPVAPPPQPPVAAQPVLPNPIRAAQASSGSSPPSANGLSMYSNDSYSAYLNRNQSPPASSAAPPGSASGAPPVASTSMYSAPPPLPTTSSSASTGPALVAQTPPPVQPQISPPIPPQKPSQNPPPNPTAISPPVPPGPPAFAGRPMNSPVVRPAPGLPLGLDGYCAVTLVERSRAAPQDPHCWQPGNAQWGVVHRGLLYLFVGPEEQKKFLANPDQFSPALSGNDPVLAFDRGQMQMGHREFGTFYEHRIYLFTSNETLEMFRHNARHYAEEVRQAESRPRGEMR